MFVCVGGGGGRGEGVKIIMSCTSLPSRRSSEQHHSVSLSLQDMLIIVHVYS